MLRAIVAGAVRFRTLTLGLAAALIVAGAVSLPRMHNDVLPELSSGPVLEVQTEALGLSSQEVEQYVTVPLENNLLDGIMGVWNVRSDSIAGLSKVDLYFEPGTTELHARQLVEERLTNAFSLPNVSKPPLLIQPLSTSSRAMMIGLSSRTVDPLELSYLARWVVKPRLEGVAGVANVAIFGQQDRQIQVQVNPGELAKHDITLQQVIDSAGNSQLVSPLSYLEGSAPGTGGFLDGPQQRLDIRPVLPLGEPKSLAALPVQGTSGHVTLGQVANIVEGHQPLIGDGLTGEGAHGVVLEIQKLPSASALGVTSGVERALAELAPALGGVRIDTSLFKPATYESSALNNLALGGVVAAALALLALIAVLLDLRAVAVAALSVALSLAGALLVLQWRGQTLNALVVLGLLVASAVLIEDAVSGTQELLRSVRDRRSNNGRALSVSNAIIEASARLRGTLGYSTLVVLLILAPVLFASGLTATYLHPMMLSIALATLASTVVAVTVTPALCVLLLERWSPKRDRRNAIRSARLVVAHDRLLRGALKLPVDLLLVVCLAGIASIVALPFLNQPAPPRFKDRSLVVQWSGPAGAGLTEMDRITTRALAELRAVPAVADAGATLGRAVSGDQIVDPSSGQIYVVLKPSADYDRAVQQVRQIVQATPGVAASVGTQEADTQAGVLAPASNDVTVRVYGEGYAELQALGAQVRRQLAGFRGLGPAHITAPAEEPNIEVSINDARAHGAGVLPGDARRQASTYVAGLTVGNFFEDQAVFDVVVIGEPSVRANLSSVADVPIDTDSGGRVPLSTVATLGVHADPVDIQHEALSRYVDVVAPVRSGGIGAARAAAEDALAAVHFPLTYHAEVLGGTPDDPTSHWTFMSYVFAALIGVLLLLQAAFGGWRMATLFVLSAPVALTGGLLVAIISGQAGTLGADAGLLALLLFAARQGVAQVAAIRRHEQDGGIRQTVAARRAAAERLWSSLAAVFVWAAALIPFVALGDVAGNEISHTAAAVMLGGLLTAAVWSHLLLPALCVGLATAEPEATEDLLDSLDPVGLAAPEPSLVMKGDS